MRSELAEFGRPWYVFALFNVQRVVITRFGNEFMTLLVLVALVSVLNSGWC